MKKTYSEKLLDPKWQRKRLCILERDNFECKMCGDEKNTLHVHHLEYIKDLDPWEYEDNKLVTLCDNCHKEIHGLSKLEIINEGVLDVSNLISTDPLLFYLTLEYISNHKGLWEIKFRKKIPPYLILKASSKIYQFNKDIDDNLEIYHHGSYINVTKFFR